MTSPRKLRIVHVAAPDLVGGLERVVQALAMGHHAAGHDVHVVSVVEPGGGDHPFPRPLRESGVPVHELRLPSRAFVRERREVRALLRDIRPDVVHTHGYRPDLLHGGPARRLSIPTVTTAHGSSKLGGKTALYEWIQERAFRRFDGVIAVSSPLAADLVQGGVPEPRVHLVPNGWSGNVRFLPREEARSRLGLEPDARVVAFVGRLIPAKGPDVFARALAELEDRDVTGLIVGDGRQRDEVESILRQAGMRDDVVMTGHLDSAAPLFRAFDLFVLSSRTEGTPIVLFEAIAAGVPTVVTTVGGVPDVVGPSEALLVPPEDPTALAGAIREAMDDPEASAARAERASRRLSEEFGAERWLARHEAVYRAVS